MFGVHTALPVIMEVFTPKFPICPDTTIDVVPRFPVYSDATKVIPKFLVCSDVDRETDFEFSACPDAIKEIVLWKEKFCLYILTTPMKLLIFFMLRQIVRDPIFGGNVSMPVLCFSVAEASSLKVLTWPFGFLFSAE